MAQNSLCSSGWLKVSLEIKTFLRHPIYNHRTVLVLFAFLQGIAFFLNNSIYKAYVPLDLKTLI